MMRLSSLTVNKARGEFAVSFRALLALLVLALAQAGCEEPKSTPFLKTSSGEEGPSKFVKPAPEDIVEDPDTGLQIIKNTLNIHFSPKLAKEEAEKIIAEFGGEVVGYDYPVNFFQARFPGEGEAFEKTRINLLSRKGVEMVTPTPVSVHKDPYYVR